MSRGISPALLFEQVSNTAGWALASELGTDPPSWRTTLSRAPEIEEHWSRDPAAPEVLRFLLAAHFSTVATFVPTDVDSRIRFHLWQALETPDALEACVAIVDEASAWSPLPVSERTVDIGTRGRLSGHDGEWLAVRAGALGRAINLGAHELVAKISASIDDELDREATAMREALAQKDLTHALSVATILAHNLGDLSRVIEAWPGPAHVSEQARRYAKLGHEDASRFGGVFVAAGAINKALMALENHRFLALRKPRALRRSRETLLPIGPFFDAWGARIARSSALEVRDRAEILGALLEMHAEKPERIGTLRAIAGLHEAHAGGIDSLLRDVPARLRKPPGSVRDALKVTEAQHLARLEKRYRLLRAELRV